MKIRENIKRLAVFCYEYFMLYTPKDRFQDWIEYKFYSFGENKEEKEQAKRSIKWKNRSDGRETYENR